MARADNRNRGQLREPAQTLLPISARTHDRIKQLCREHALDPDSLINFALDAFEKKEPESE